MKMRTRWMNVLALAAVVPFSGCFLAGHTSSPWEFGAGFRAAPALWDAGEDLTVHPALGYTYLSFDGGNDQLFEVGAQVRKPLSGDTPLWIGGEATISRLRTSIDVGGGSFSGSTNGWSLTALGGMPFGESRWGTSLFAGVGISDYGAQGWNVRFGIDLQPSFLWEN